MTQAQALARFSAGGTHAGVGSVKVVSRSHRCNSLSGCTPWSEDARVVFWVSGSPNHVWDAASPMTGRVELDIVNSKIVPTMTMQVGGDGQSAPKQHRTTFTGGIDAPLSLTGTQWGDWAGWGWPFWEGPESSSVQSRAGVLGEHCFRWSVKVRKNLTNQEWNEIEYAYYGNY